MLSSDPIVSTTAAPSDSDSDVKFLISNAEKDRVAGRADMLARILQRRSDQLTSHPAPEPEPATCEVCQPVTDGAYEVVDMPINKIIVGSRHRKDNGDLTQLCESMTQEGLLHHIAVDRDNRLVFGGRRLQAAKSLGWKTIPVRVLDLKDLVAAEYAENRIRKEFTFSERFNIAQAVANTMPQRWGKDKWANWPTQKGRRTRDLVAQQAGFDSGKEYERVKIVVETGVPALIAMLDNRKVSPSAAAEVAALPRAEQDQLVQGGKDAITAAIRDLRGRRASQRPNRPKNIQPDAWVLLCGPQLHNVPEYAVQIVFKNRPTKEWLTNLLKSIDNSGASVLATTTVTTDPK